MRANSSFTSLHKKQSSNGKKLVWRLFAHLLLFDFVEDALVLLFLLHGRFEL